jgi:hypothetical protein
MVTTEEWIDSQVAPTQQELERGDGCHEEEGRCLKDYLAGKMTVQDAAAAITTPVLNEKDPPSELYRLWALLADALVELEQGREKLYDLLAAIQELGSQGPIDFSDLPGFGNMWADLYQMWRLGTAPWEKDRGPITDEEMFKMREHHKATGIVEATLYVRGIADLPEIWAWDAINIVCLERPGLDAYIGEVYGWLTVASEKLRSSTNLDQVVTFSRTAEGGRPGARTSVSQSVSEHMGYWNNRLIQLSSQDSSLSEEGRRLAAECYRLLGRDDTKE